MSLPSYILDEPLTVKFAEGEVSLIPNLEFVTSAYKKFVSLINVELEAYVKYPGKLLNAPPLIPEVPLNETPFVPAKPDVPEVPLAPLEPLAPEEPFEPELLLGH